MILVLETVGEIYNRRAEKLKQTQKMHACDLVTKNE